jgi:hypothetical protein
VLSRHRPGQASPKPVNEITDKLRESLSVISQRYGACEGKFDKTEKQILREKWELIESVIPDDAKSAVLWMFNACGVVLPDGSVPLLEEQLLGGGHEVR